MAVVIQEFEFSHQVPAQAAPAVAPSPSEPTSNVPSGIELQRREQDRRERMLRLYPH